MIVMIMIIVMMVAVLGDKQTVGVSVAARERKVGA
jgi:hypothetical protein